MACVLHCALGRRETAEHRQDGMGRMEGHQEENMNKTLETAMSQPQVSSCMDMPKTCPQGDVRGAFRLYVYIP